MTGKTTRAFLPPAITALVSLGILGGILTAGVWPFHRPINRVTWLEQRNGLRFDRRGIVFSRDTLPLSADRSCSVEMMVRATSPWQSAVMLSLYAPDGSRSASVRHSVADLVLERDGIPRIDIVDVFRRPGLRLIAITSGTGGTRVYLDGVLSRTAPNLRFCGDFDGQLMLGASATRDLGWSGELWGLALYNWELDPATVGSHYSVWTSAGERQAAGRGAIAIYLFDEHQGRMVHNRAGTGGDLDIPERYQLPHQLFLERPWSEFRRSWSYVEDVLINIGGFIPFGFWFCCYWTWIRPIKRPALTTVIAGGLLSLSIELLQSLLPTRNSGMTDLFTNSLGTYVGVVLFQLETLQPLYGRIASMLSGRLET
jgi:hypothetical protein